MPARRSASHEKPQREALALSAKAAITHSRRHRSVQLRQGGSLQFVLRLHALRFDDRHAHPHAIGDLALHAVFELRDLAACAGQRGLGVGRNSVHHRLLARSLLCKQSPQWKARVSQLQIGRALVAHTKALRAAAELRGVHGGGLGALVAFISDGKHHVLPTRVDAGAREHLGVQRVESPCSSGSGSNGVMSFTSRHSLHRAGTSTA